VIFLVLAALVQQFDILPREGQEKNIEGREGQEKDIGEEKGCSTAVASASFEVRFAQRAT